MGASYLPWAKNLSFSSRKGGAPQYLFDYAKLMYQKSQQENPWLIREVLLVSNLALSVASFQRGLQEVRRGRPLAVQVGTN